MINKILDFIKYAGKLALDNQNKISIVDEHIRKESDNNSDIVTKTDLEISKLFKTFVESNFSGLNYMIVDEESISTLPKDMVKNLKDIEYTFVIDPIDGTHPYSLKMPEFGISIGVLKYGKPYLGVIYAPALHELAYFDGKSSYWLQNVGAGMEHKIEIKQVVVSPNAILLDNPWYIKVNNNIDFRRDCTMNLYSAVLNFLLIITGRAKGYYCMASLWDIAGAWPIVKNIGCSMLDYSNGKSLEKVSLDDFDENFRMKELKIVSEKDRFKHLKNVVDLK